MPTYAQHFKAGATLIHALYTIDEVYADDKVDWDDASTIASFVAWEAVFWGSDFLEWRNIHKKPLYIIEAAIIAGGVISYGIAGREGLMDYTDFMTGKVGPKEYYDVVAPEVKRVVKERVADVKREVKETVAQTVAMAELVYGVAVRKAQAGAEAVQSGMEAAYEFVEDLPGFWLNPTPGWQLF